MIDHRFACTEDIAAIRRLWRGSFPADTDEEIDDFLRVVDLPTECLLAVENGVPVSMVFTLPAILKIDGERLPVQYIYAAATLPEQRGRGLFGALLKTALAAAREKGCAASFLRPAEPSLGDYYARFGYRPFFYREVLEGMADGTAAVTAVSTEVYVKIRELHLPSTAILWEPRFLSGTVIVEDGCAVCEPRDGVLHIHELLCDEPSCRRLCEELAAHFGCGTYRCSVPAREAVGEPFGWACFFKKIEVSGVPYMGIALD